MFNEEQVTIVLREGDKLNVPEFDQIYSYDMVSGGRSCIGNNRGQHPGYVYEKQASVSPNEICTTKGVSSPPGSTTAKMGWEGKSILSVIYLGETCIG